MWDLDLAAPILLGLPESGGGHGIKYYNNKHKQTVAGMVFAKQGHVRWHGEKTWMKVGRFEFMDGAELVSKNGLIAAVKRDRVVQRLIATFGWTHVGRSFDGEHFNRIYKGMTLTSVSATPTSGVFSNGRLEADGDRLLLSVSGFDEEGFRLAGLSNLLARLAASRQDCRADWQPSHRYFWRPLVTDTGAIRCVALGSGASGPMGASRSSSHGRHLRRPFGGRGCGLRSLTAPATRTSRTDAMAPFFRFYPRQDHVQE